MLHLQITDARGHIIVARKLGTLPCTVGRLPDNDIVLNDRSISGHHVAIHSEDGQLYLSDLGSANGILANGERTNRVALNQKVECEIGRLRLIVIPEGASLDPTELIDRSAVSESEGASVPQPPGPVAGNAASAPQPLAAALQGSHRMAWALAGAGIALGVAFRCLLLVIESDRSGRKIASEMIGLIGPTLLVAFVPSVICLLHAKRWRYPSFVALFALAAGLTSLFEVVEGIWVLNYGQDGWIAGFLGVADTLVLVALLVWVIFLVFPKIQTWKLLVAVGSVGAIFAAYLYLQEELEPTVAKYRMAFTENLSRKLTLPIRKFTPEEDSVDKLAKCMERDFDELESAKADQKEH